MPFGGHILTALSMTGIAEIGIAMRVVDVRADQVSEGAADENVGREVIAAGEPSDGYGKRCAVSHHFDPRPWIFVADHTHHSPHKHWVAGGKGRIHASMLPEAAVARTIIGAFSSGNELHGGVNEERIRKRLESEIPRLLGVRVVGAKAVQPDQAGTDTSGPDAQQRYVVADVYMIGRNLARRLAVGGEKGAGR